MSVATYRSFNQTYSDTGLWGVYFAADRFTVDDALHEVWYSECLRVQRCVCSGCWFLREKIPLS